MRQYDRTSRSTNDRTLANLIKPYGPPSPIQESPEAEVSGDVAFGPSTEKALAGLGCIVFVVGLLPLKKAPGGEQTSVRSRLIVPVGGGSNLQK